MGRKRKSQKTDEEPLDFNGYDDDDNDDKNDDDDVDDDVSINVSLVEKGPEKLNNYELKEKQLRYILAKESDDWLDPEDDIMYGYKD